MKQSLTEGKVSRHLINLTIPMIWGVLSVIAFSLIDTYYVGRLGTDSLAAMSFTFPVVMSFGSLAMGLGVGASSVISRAIGEGDNQFVKRLTTDSLSLSLIMVVIFVSIGLTTIEPLFTLLGATEKLLPLIRSYMEIWYWGTICLVVPMVGNNAIRASGNTFVPSIIMIVAAGVNIILDPIFIFGLFGFPRLELAGAAIATVVSRFVTLVAALWFLHFRLKMLCFQKESLGVIVKSWGKILRIGLPASATNLITPISIGIITELIAFYGATAVASFGIASRIESFALIILMALSGSVSPFVGQNWGAKKYNRVRIALKQCFIFCLFLGFLTAAVLAGIGKPIASVFDSDFEVISTVTNYLQIVPVSYAFYGIILVTSSMFNALGNPTPSVIITALRMFVFYIPLAYLGSNLFGINGIFIGASLANILVGIIAYLWTKKTCNKSPSEADVNPPLDVTEEEIDEKVYK